MNKLTISKILFSKISPITHNISTINLIDLGLSGGFGTIYKAVIANSKNQSYKFAIKVFHDISNTHGYTTINSLIDKINDYELNASESLKSIASLQALPLFSFEGKLKGKIVRGYVTYFLNHNEYMSLDEILATKSNEYNQLGLDERLYLSEQLCRAVQGLEKLTYIHADINAQNILINLINLDLVLIDFDSGAITDSNNNVPSTWGKPNDWIAPEIRKQIDDKNQSITINIHSDRFSVMVGIHYLIFIQSPYCFLKNMSEQTMTSYLNTYKWPNVPRKKEKYFHKICPAHSKLVTFIKTKTPNLFTALEIGFNDGYFNTNQRVTYGQLLSRLKNNHQPNITTSQPKIIKSKPKSKPQPIPNPIQQIKKQTTFNNRFSNYISTAFKLFKYAMIFVLVGFIVIFAYKKFIQEDKELIIDDSNLHTPTPIIRTNIDSGINLKRTYSYTNKILSFSHIIKDGDKINFSYILTTIQPPSIKKSKGYIDTDSLKIYLDGMSGEIHKNSDNSISIKIDGNLFL